MVLFIIGCELSQVYYLYFLGRMLLHVFGQQTPMAVLGRFFTTEETCTVKLLDTILA